MGPAICDWGVPEAPALRAGARAGLRSYGAAGPPEPRVGRDTRGAGTPAYTALGDPVWLTAASSPVGSNGFRFRAFDFTPTVTGGQPCFFARLPRTDLGRAGGWKEIDG